MPSVGQELRAARELQKLSIHQVAETTKIKGDHVRALEAGQFEVFSAPVYIRGFVRTYARHLKLDEARLLAELDKELGATQRTPQRAPDIAGPNQGPLDILMLQLSRLNWRLWAGLVLGCAVVFASISFIRQAQSNRKEDPLKGLGAGMYQPTQSSSGEVLPFPTSK